MTTNQQRQQQQQNSKLNCCLMMKRQQWQQQYALVHSISRSVLNGRPTINLFVKLSTLRSPPIRNEEKSHGIHFNTQPHDSTHPMRQNSFAN